MTGQRRQMLADGLVAGVLGYGVVVIFFMGLDLVSGRPLLYTAALLGEALFGGLRDPGLLTVDPTLVLAFNGVHLLAVLAFGFFAAWLAYEAELHPEFWYVAFFLFLAGALAGYAGVLAVTVMVGSLVSPWWIALAGLLGVVAVGGYLAASHRSLVRGIRDSLAVG